MEIRILDFDASLTSQGNLLSKYNPKIIGLRSLSSSARLWMSRKTARHIRFRIQGLSNGITFLGSGDYHHISSLLTENINEPAVLIVFDFHPDWDVLPPALGCGSWVTEALKNPNIVKCLLIGPSSCDLSFPLLQSANLKALMNNRLEIYPYMHDPSTVFLRRVPLNNSIKLRKGLFKTEISWSELKGKNLNDFFLPLITGLPAKKVYLSIDKDCLNSSYALTNWEEGLFSLGDLLAMLKIIKDNCNILGADITGEYSHPLFFDALKAIIARLDHPKDTKAGNYSLSKIREVNESANLKILSLLSPQD